MVKIRIYELAKELNIPSKELVDKAKSLGMDVKSHMSVVTETESNKIKQNFVKKANDSKSVSNKKAVNKTPNDELNKNHQAQNKNKGSQDSKAKIKISVKSIRKPNTSPQNNKKNRDNNLKKNFKNNHTSDNKNNSFNKTHKTFDAKAQADSIKRRQNKELYEKTFENSSNPQKELDKKRAVKQKNIHEAAKK